MGRGGGEFNADAEAAGWREEGADRAAAGLDGGADDGEAEAGAAGFTAAGAVGPVKRFEEAGEFGGVGAWAVIGEGEGDRGEGGFGGEGGGGVWAGVGGDVAE